MIPHDGVNPYSNHPGFEANDCSLRYTVTHQDSWGNIRGGFGCEISGSHCLPCEECDVRKAKYKEHQDLLSRMEGIRK